MSRWKVPYGLTWTRTGRSGRAAPVLAADRYRAAAAEFSDRYAGTYLGKRELRALVANPRLQVYEDPKAFLTCDHDAFTALCNPRPRPSARRRSPYPGPLPLPSGVREHQR